MSRKSGYVWSQIVGITPEDVNYYKAWKGRGGAGLCFHSELIDFDTFLFKLKQEEQNEVITKRINELEQIIDNEKS